MFTNLARPVGPYLPLISIFKSKRNTHGIKEGSSCSHNQREEQEHHRRMRCNFGHHNLKQGNSSFCLLFHPCINHAKRTRAPKARVCDHLSLTKGTKGGSPRKYSESMLSDADSSGSSAMQVMTTGATSIDEQLAQMNEAIARLTRNVEEKYLQIAAVIN
ncbi:hypothetical protein ACFX1Q_009987 [Malus domestica]